MGRPRKDGTVLKKDGSIVKAGTSEPISQKTNKKKTTPVAKKTDVYLAKFKELVSLYFPSVTEESKKKKKVCTMCGRNHADEDYWRSFSFINVARMNKDYRMCLPICGSCASNLFDFLLKKHHGSHKLAMEHACCELNIYWDEKIFERAKSLYEGKTARNTKTNFFGEYASAIGRAGIDYLGKTYWDSIIEQKKLIEEQQKALKEKADRDAEQFFDYETEGKWGDGNLWQMEDVENRKKILKVYRYDPFEYEDEEDKISLYRDLVAMLDDAMEDDYVKSRGALEVVRGFNKIEKLGKQILVMERNNEDANLIKKYVDMKATERASITAYCKDNGFAASYGLKKAKGAGTLSGIMKEMDEKKYERAILNRYDALTSESIEQAAEASVKAIFSQLDIGNNESYTIIQQQAEKIRTMQKKLDKTEEELRLERCRVVELELKKKAEEEGN